MDAQVQSSKGTEDTRVPKQAKTFDEVLENVKEQMGFSKIGVTLGPEATPESLQNELNKFFDLSHEYGNFTKEERLEARVAHYKSILDKVAALSKVDAKGFGFISPEMLELTRKFSDMVGMRSSIHMEKDIEFMKGLRNGKYRSELPGRY